MIRDASQQLANAPLTTGNTAFLDAQILAGHVLGFDRGRLIAESSRVLDDDTVNAINALMARRLAGEPIAYITGQREFWSLPITVTPDVLIPRPETELLVEVALATLQENQLTRVADLGTGSGAIALAIASEISTCELTATDASDAALAVAEANAAKLGFANINFKQSVWFKNLQGEIYDLIVSNPPYIVQGDPHLARGDVRYEPHVALASGTDGMDDIRIIVAQSPQYLSEQGTLYVEHGFDQGQRVRECFARAKFVDVNTYRDLAGHERVTGGSLIVLDGEHYSMRHNMRH